MHDVLARAAILIRVLAGDDPHGGLRSRNGNSCAGGYQQPKKLCRAARNRC